MRVRLVACAEPYTSYAAMPRDPSGSLVLFGKAEADEPPEIQVLPAELFLALPGESRRVQLSIAYGPARLMEACFDAGCIDYLRDPWPLEELEARLRRFERPRFTLASLPFELRGCMLVAPERSLRLRESERRLLLILVLNRGRAVPREAMRSAIGGRSAASSRVCDVHIASIRKKLDSLVPGAGECLRANRGIGYHLEIEACG